MDSIDRTASQHERRAATWLVTGVAVSLATGLTPGLHGLRLPGGQGVGGILKDLAQV